MTAEATPGDSPGFLLWRATLRWQRHTHAALKPLGLTHVQFVLLAGVWWLGEHGEQPSQRDLAEHASTDVMMTSQVVRALESRDLLRRVTDPSDARKRLLQATPEGARLAQEAIRVVEATDQHFFGYTDQAAVLKALRPLAAWANRDERTRRDS